MTRLLGQSVVFPEIVKLFLYVGLLKKSLSNPWPKVLDNSQLFVADVKKTFSVHFWDTQYKNNFDFVALINKSYYKP